MASTSSDVIDWPGIAVGWRSSSEVTTMRLRFPWSETKELMNSCGSEFRCRGGLCWLVLSTTHQCFSWTTKTDLLLKQLEHNVEMLTQEYPDVIIILAGELNVLKDSQTPP